MNFLAPGAFFLGLLLPVIVVFYLLKLRRIEQNIPSVYLWRRMVRDVEANAPWQRLHFNLLMILQLLFLVALILALTRPFTWAEGAGGQSAIFILDTSASMSAIDVTPSRLESARQRARQLINDLPDSARVTVIEAGREALVRLSSSLDRRQAFQALDAIHAGTASSDMAVALELASAIAARQSGTEIFVLSDGRVELPERLALRGTLRYLPFGLSGENQAISLLTLEPAPGGRGMTAFAQISNYGSQPASRRLSLYADGQLVNVYDLQEIPPGRQQTVLAEDLPATTQLIEARLEPNSGSFGDIFALDDIAQAVQPQVRPVNVNLVGGNNLFIRTALSLLPGITLTQIEPQVTPNADTNSQSTPVVPTGTPTPSSDNTASAAPSPADLTIYDNQPAPEVLPDGNLLFIAPPASTSLFTIQGTVENPQPRALDLNDPILEHVTLSDISVLDAVDVALPDWALPVIGGDLQDGSSVPLLFRGEVEDRRVAVLAFDLHHSDLPLNIAFPLMWVNLINWLAPGASSLIPVQVAPGENITFASPGTFTAGDEAQIVTITRPDGSSVQVEAESGRYIYADTTQLGLYRVSFGSSSPELLFTVNLFSPQESSLLPADNLPGLLDQQNPGSQGTQLGQREWWRPLAFLALGLLFGEWLVYQRAGLVRLKDLLLGVFTGRSMRATTPRKGRK